MAGPMAVGTRAAAISGYAAIVFLLRLVRTSSYRRFVLYPYAAGIAILIVIATGVRPAPLSPLRPSLRRNLGLPDL